MSDIENSPKNNKRSFMGKTADDSKNDQPHNKPKKSNTYLKKQDKKRSHLTIDIKRYRILKVLYSLGEAEDAKRPNLYTLQQKAFKTTQKNTIPEYLSKMVDDEWVEENHPRGKSTPTYSIAEKGRDVITLLRLIKKKIPDNPLLSFDTFTISPEEKNKEDLELTGLSDEEAEKFIKQWFKI